MAGEINLLPQKQYEAEQKEKALRWIYLAITVLLILDLVVVVAVFGYWTTKKVQINNSNNKITKVTQTIKNYKNVEVLQQVVKQESKSIVSIEATKRNMNNVLDKIAELTPEGVRLENFSVSEKNEIGAKVTSRDPYVFSSFLINLADENKGGKYLSDISVGSLTSDSSGVYSCSLQFNLKPGAFE
jgi:Tfp pilus assembly protein PilN